MNTRKRTDYIVVHCSATRPSQDIGLLEIDKWHRQRGFRKVGYHYIIRRDGTVELGRSLDEIGAHARGFNSRSVSICMVGGVAEDNVKQAENNFTPAQFSALSNLTDTLKELYNEAEVIGHRDLPNVAKDCPSFNVKEWLLDTTSKT